MRKAALGIAIGTVGVAAVVALLAAARSRDERTTAPSAIVLIVVDTLRADRMAAWGAEREVTPRLDAWFERAVKFEQARAPSPWTLPSFASMYTGLYPTRHGASVVDPLVQPRAFVDVDERLPQLAEILRDAGWDTAGFTTNRFLSPTFGLARGFRKYEQTWTPGGSPPRADVTVDSALEWLDSSPDSPFFLALHVFDPHMPYDPPARTRGRFSSGYGGDIELPIRKLKSLRSGEMASGEADRAFVVDAYDEEIAFADEHLGRFLDGLEERGWLDRALIVLTSDHGEELWDHGGFEHGHTVRDELLHVPLGVWAPGVPPRSVSEPVTLTDLLPTILDAAGLTVPDDLDGISLWPAIAGRRALPRRVLLAESPLYVTARRAIFEWPWKLIDRIEDGERELFDLENDPNERNDVADRNPDVVERLLAATAARAGSPADSSRTAVPLDLETREALRALGYVD